MAPMFCHRTDVVYDERIHGHRVSTPVQVSGSRQPIRGCSFSGDELTEDVLSRPLPRLTLSVTDPAPLRTAVE